MEFNKQDLNTHGNEHINHTHTPGTELTNNDTKRGQETNHIRKQEAGTQDTHDRGLTGKSNASSKNSTESNTEKPSGVMSCYSQYL